MAVKCAALMKCSGVQLLVKYVLNNGGPNNLPRTQENLGGAKVCPRRGHNTWRATCNMVLYLVRFS